MVWTTRTQCVWIVMLMSMTGSCSVALKCEDYCDGCSTTTIVCHGGLYSEMVSVLPSYTQALTYVAQGEWNEVNLGVTNFGNLTGLRILNITTHHDLKAIRLSMRSAQQNVFAPLAKLQILKINVGWWFAEPLDDLFKPLILLEELDLSQTIEIDITCLQRAMYGFSNSTSLKTVKLSHIQEKGDIYTSILNLTWFLEPLQNCPITRLYLANNDLAALYPGIIRYTPLLEYFDVSHNLLYNDFSVLPFQLLPLAQEIILHKRLLEVDYSNQRQSTGLFGSNPSLPDQKGFISKRKNLRTGAYQMRISSLLPDYVHAEPWSQCITDMYDGCDLFSPNCSDTLNYLRHNHSEFCEMLYDIGMFPPIIPCSALPAIDDVYQESCEFCEVYPMMGSLKRLKLYNEYKWDKKLNDLYTSKQENLCFHQSNQLEYLDVSGNVLLAQDFVQSYSQSTGLKHIKVLNVSDTGITSVFENMLLNFPNLQIMDVSRNNVVFYKERSVSLSSNGVIQFLNFAHNQINFVPQNVFSNLVSLRQLNLSHNRIHDFDFNISRLYSLENLTLENNMISEIPEATREQLIQLAERIAPRVITVD